MHHDIWIAGRSIEDRSCLLHSCILLIEALSDETIDGVLLSFLPCRYASGVPVICFDAL